MKCVDITDVEVLAALRDIDARKRLAHYPERLVDAKLRKMERRGLIECGVSLWTSSLTEDGEAILAAAGEPMKALPSLTPADREWIIRAVRAR